MKPAHLAVAALLLAPAAALAAEPAARHFPVAPGPAPANFSAAVQAGNTLYISGGIDVDPATGKPGTDITEAAKNALNGLKKNVEAAGMTMDDLVWVQIFCSDLSYYGKFNDVYRTYFKGPLPARAFLGVDHLLQGAHFEMMGVAVKAK